MQSRPITNSDYNKVELQDVGLFYNMQLCNNMFIFSFLLLMTYFIVS